MASRLFTVDLDLGLNKARRFIFEDFSSNPTGTTGRVIYWTAADSSANHLKVYNGNAWKTIAYTDDVPTISISLDAPDLFTVSGSPANATGTLAFEWNTAAVNTILAGPGTGSTAAIPTFRSLVAADIPSIESGKISDFSEAVADTVGAMVTSNTENGISVTYDDADNTLDFDVADFSITLTGDVTGSGTVTNLGNVSFAATVGDDTHNHTTSTLTGIQEFVEDTASTMISTATHDGISVLYTDNAGAAGTLAFTNTDKGSSQNIFKTIAVAGQTSIAADTNADTLTIVGSGIAVTTDAGTDTLTFTNSGVTSISGTAGEVEVSGSTGSITIGLPNDVTIGNDLIVTGNLTVSGSTTTLNTETVTIEDNIIILNSNVTGTPSTNSGIEVERGASTNASVVWNESTDKWTAGITGSEIAIARKVVATTTGTTHTITHNLATSDVTVNCWLAGSQVEADIVVTDSNTVTVTTNSSITDLKTVVVG